jgi:hypothetical protein
MQMRLIIGIVLFALAFFVASRSPDPHCHYRCALQDLLHWLSH